MSLFKRLFGKDEARDDVDESPSDSRAGSHKWVRQGRSFAEMVSQRKTEAAQGGINLVEFYNFEDIAKSNWAPGTILCYALAGKPHAIAMVHEVQTNYLPLIQNYVALGACRLRGKFFQMPEYPLVYLGLSANIRFIDDASNKYAIFESVVNFVEANFQDWVNALESKEFTILHLMGPDRRHIVTGHVNVDTHVIASIVDAVNRANSAFETSRETAWSFDKALTRFFQQHQEPLLWSI